MRRHLTYANVVSSICLFILLGGAAYAATALPRNSVGNRQLKKNAVTSSKIRNNSVTPSKVKNNTVTSSKVKDDALTGADIKEGTLGTVPTAAALTGLRYARVNYDGTVDGSPSSGITNANVSHPHAGTYCFTGLSGVHVIQATAQAAGRHVAPTDTYSSDFIATAVVGAPVGGFTSNCPPGTSASVQIARPGISSGPDSTYTYTDYDSAFYVVIY